MLGNNFSLWSGLKKTGRRASAEGENRAWRGHFHVPPMKVLMEGGEKGKETERSSDDAGDGPLEEWAQTLRITLQKNIPGKIWEGVLVEQDAPRPAGWKAPRQKKEKNERLGPFFVFTVGRPRRRTYPPSWRRATRAGSKLSSVTGGWRKGTRKFVQPRPKQRMKKEGEREQVS